MNIVRRRRRHLYSKTTVIRPFPNVSDYNTDNYITLFDFMDILWLLQVWFTNVFNFMLIDMHLK